MSLDPFAEIASSISASQSAVEDLFNKVGKIIEENNATNLTAMLALSAQLTSTMERLINETKTHRPTDLDMTVKVILSFLRAIHESLANEINEPLEEIN